MTEQTASKAKSATKGAFILTLGLILGKIFGAVYKIPLANALNTDGMGMYQLIFSVYAFLVTITSGATPLAISLIISRKRAAGNEDEIDKVIISAALIFTAMGLVSAVLLAALAKEIGKLQGVAEVYIGYFVIAPALPAVCVTATVKGYFQGYSDMRPSALAESAEAGIKLAIGLTAAFALKSYGTLMAVSGALFGVTAAEYITMAIMLGIYIKKRKLRKVDINKSDIKIYTKEIFKIAFPLFACAMLYPLSQMLDGFIIVNIVKPQNDCSPQGVYGIYSGYIAALINFPVTLGISFGIAAVPDLSVAKATRNVYNIKTKLNMIVKLSLIIVAIVTLLFIIFPYGILKILYPTLQNYSLEIAALLLRIGGINAIFIVLAQVLNSFLQGIGFTGYTIANTLLGVAVKLLASVILLPKVGIVGASISALLGNAVTAFMNAYKLYYLLGWSKDFIKNIGVLTLIGGIIGGVGYLIVRLLGGGSKECLIFALPLVVFYVVLLLVFGVFKRSELFELPGGKVWVKISDAISVKGKRDVKLRKT